MAAGSTYSTIATTTLASAAASYTFSSIPTTYTDLILVLNGSFDTFNNVRFQVGNGSVDTGSNYSATRLLGDGSAASSDRISNTTGGYIITINTNQVMGLVHFQNYSNTTTYKTMLARGGAPGTSDYVSANVNLWRSTSAINTIKIYPNSGNMNTGMTLTLYGIAAA